MDRADRIGYWISGVTHAGLIGAALAGGALFRPQPLDAVRMAEVATMSEAEFQSLASAAAGRGPVGDTAAATPAGVAGPALSWPHAASARIATAQMSLLMRRKSAVSHSSWIDPSPVCRGNDAKPASVALLFCGQDADHRRSSRLR